MKDSDYLFYENDSLIKQSYCCDRDRQRFREKQVLKDPVLLVLIILAPVLSVSMSCLRLYLEISNLFISC